MFVDHIDGNRLNDHPDNLRLVTPQQNQWNRDNLGGKLQNYLPKGIDFVKAEGRYEVSKPEGYKPRKRRLPGYAKTHDGLKVYIEPKTGRLYFKKLHKKHYIDEESVVV